MSEEREALREKLLSPRKNGYDRIKAEELQAMERYCGLYKTFLQQGKTERECARVAVELAEKAGFKPYERGTALAAGDKIYRVNRDKSVMLAVIGRESLAQGAHIVAAHIDSPRLDLKPNPLYEDSELAFFKTHYYGGIRKYQWVTIPLELRGVVAKKDGTVVPVRLGEGDEAKFVITDLLPHLGGEQGKKPLNEAVPGESLNILLGSCPSGEEDEKDRVKMRILEKLFEKYGITEDDFTSAELEAVPAASPRISAWTPASSAPTATMTGCAATLACGPYWSSPAPPRPPCVCWRTRRRSVLWALRVCSPPPLIPLCTTCATGRVCLCGPAMKTPSASPAM